MDVTKPVIRFRQYWRGREVNHVERGFDYGTAATLVGRNIAEWFDEAPAKEAEATKSMPMPATNRDDRQGRRVKR